MREFTNFNLLNGFMGDLPTLSGKISVLNIEYLDRGKNIYQAPICSDYRILYFFFGEPQTVTLCSPESEPLTMTVPADAVLSVSARLRHKFEFMPLVRPATLVIYYQILSGTNVPSPIQEYQNDELELIHAFRLPPYSVTPIHSRLMRELAITNDYLATSTKGDALKLRNQLCNIFLSVFQQNQFAPGANYEEKLQDSLSRNTNFVLRQRILECAFDGVPLKDVSDDLHYTARHIQRLVSRCYGEGFAKVVLNFRVSYLMLLLHETDLPLRDAGRQAGFTNEKMMFQAFKAVTGTTPAKFRKQYEKERDRKQTLQLSRP